jgi:hypothetical protein
VTSFGQNLRGKRARYARFLLHSGVIKTIDNLDR